MALTDYIFNLSYFHIGQLAQKTQNLQKLWCVHVLKTLVPAVSRQLKFCHFPAYTEAVPNSHWDYKWTADLWLCYWASAVLKKGKKNPKPTENTRSNFPIVLFFKEILLLWFRNSNRFSCYTHTCTSGSLNSTSAKHTGKDEHASLTI